MITTRARNVHRTHVSTASQQTRVVAMATTDADRHGAPRTPSALPTSACSSSASPSARRWCRPASSRRSTSAPPSGFMESGGWRLPTFAALLVTAAETAGGVGAAAGSADARWPRAAWSRAMIDAWAVNVSGAAFWSDPFNVPFLVAFAAAALLFTGAGAYSVDAKVFGRPRWPAPSAVALFLVGGRRGGRHLDRAERHQPAPPRATRRAVEPYRAGKNCQGFPNRDSKNS